jgi:hypothetical protein
VFPSITIGFLGSQFYAQCATEPSSLILTSSRGIFHLVQTLNNSSSPHSYFKALSIDFRSNGVTRRFVSFVEDLHQDFTCSMSPILHRYQGPQNLAIGPTHFYQAIINSLQPAYLHGLCVYSAGDMSYSCCINQKVFGGRQHSDK